MAVSVRMSPLLEKELELAAQRKGVTKSQFIIEAVERALGRSIQIPADPPDAQKPTPTTPAARRVIRSSYL